MPGLKIDVPPIPVLAPRAADQRRFAQLNFHNFFDAVDAPSVRDTVVEKDAFRRQTALLAFVIRDALGSPDVITGQEIETLDNLRYLVSHDAIAHLEYEPLLLPGSDNRGINNAILYRPESMTLKQVLQLDPLVATETGRLPHLFTRPPLIAQFGINGREDAARGVKEVWVMSNHLTSKLGGEEAAVKRGQQAESIARFAHGLQEVDPRAGVIVAGDMNMGRMEPEFAPLRTRTRGAALDDATRGIPSDERFTYVYRGDESQLDHVLVSKNMTRHVEFAVIPNVMERLGRNGTSDPVRGKGLLDHRPVVVTFSS